MITAAAGFFLASKGHINLWLLLATLAGMSLVIASACVINNYIDRDIDALMARTKKRAFVLGLAKPRSAIIYAGILGLCGVLILAVYTNLLTVCVGLVGFIDYVILYGIFKRRSVHATVVGSISGAMPIVAGYTAVTGRINAGALILFLILVLWQMPHFYAIAIYRLDDYGAANIPVLPIVKGLRVTKLYMLLYIVAFIVATIMLTVSGYTGYVYLAVAVAVGLMWLGVGLKGISADNDKLWARKMFLVSLLVITVLCLAISVDAILP